MGHRSDSVVSFFFFFWGGGLHVFVCGVDDTDARDLSPGRFYAAAVLKLVLARFLLDYDCELQPFRGGRSVQWRSTVVPKGSIKLVVRQRTEKGGACTP